METHIHNVSLSISVLNINLFNRCLLIGKTLDMNCSHVATLAAVACGFICS